ncbi:MAG TPA: hypothetical protein VK912_00685 [Longimicrobiales bacterium]|nr:hypothetical protein [Longimicrobiales bacterium]
MRTFTSYKAAVAVAALAVMAGCEQSSEITAVQSFEPSAVTLPMTPAAGVIYACKDYAGTGTFDFTATNFTTVNGTLHTGANFQVDADACVLVASTPTMSGNFVQVTVSEVVPATATLTKIELYTFNASNPGAGWNGQPMQTFTSVDGIQTRAGNDLGRVIVFYNEAMPDEGEEGCTPGYWKNHEASWAATGYSPAQLAGSVFALGGYPTLASNTLLESLSNKGGPGADGAASILIRAAVAALLNASSPDVDYTMTAAEIIAAVDAALASNDRETMLSLAADLDYDNNLGCPLN